MLNSESVCKIDCEKKKFLFKKIKNLRIKVLYKTKICDPLVVTKIQLASARRTGIIFRV